MDRYRSGVFTDPTGTQWDVEFNMERYAYILRNRDTGERREVEEEYFNPRQWSNEILNVYNKQRTYINQWRTQPTRLSLEARWRSRMLRLAEKAKAKRLRKVTQAGWILGWVWGTIIATIVTMKLVMLASVLVLG